MNGKLTYADIGATRRPEALPPPGYHLLRIRTRVGAGPGVLSRAGRAVLDWRMHRAVGVSIDAEADEAAPGVTVVVGLGIGRWRLRAPCQVVWTVRAEDRVGFGYGTLPGHPEDGEESFVVERDANGTVWLAVTAFSRPNRWYLRLAGPLARAGQRAYARRCGRVLRRIAAPPRR